MKTGITKTLLSFAGLTIFAALAAQCKDQVPSVPPASSPASAYSPGPGTTIGTTAPASTVTITNTATNTVTNTATMTATATNVITGVPGTFGWWCDRYKAGVKYPYCADSSSDPKNGVVDGWGYENGLSCVVRGGQAEAGGGDCSTVVIAQPGR